MMEKNEFNLQISKGNYRTFDNIDDKEVVKGYRKVMFEFRKFINSDDASEKGIKKQLNRILAFEKKLIKVSMDFRVILNSWCIPNFFFFNHQISSQVGEEEYDTDYPTIKYIQEQYPFLHWWIYNLILPPDSILSEDQRILILDRQFLYKLENLLDLTTTSTLINYILWRVMNDEFAIKVSEAGLCQLY